MPQLTFAAQGQSRGTGNGADEVLIGRGSWPLPKSSETVRAAGHNRGAIGAEGYGRDRPRMAERRSQRLTSFHVPDAGAAIYAAGAAGSLAQGVQAARAAIADGSAARALERYVQASIELAPAERAP